MIRKIFSVLFGLLLLAVAARAETGEEIALAAYPGYVVASSDSGNGFGVFALENGNETALCIVEDGRLTIANERAFKAGKNVKVYVDTASRCLSDTTRNMNMSRCMRSIGLKGGPDATY